VDRKKNWRGDEITLEVEVEEEEAPGSDLEQRASPSHLVSFLATTAKRLNRLPVIIIQAGFWPCVQRAQRQGRVIYWEAAM
jgi:hypothetical protein